jgi:hypothetical protein
MPKSVAPIQTEAKATWTKWAAALFSAAAAAVIADPSLIDGAPAWVRALVAFALGTGLVKAAGHYAPHTFRTDVVPPGFGDLDEGDLEAEAAAYKANPLPFDQSH